MAKRIDKVKIDEFENLESYKGFIVKGNKYKCICDMKLSHDDIVIANLKKR